MSAIFGVIGRVSPGELAAMAERLAHRGGHPCMKEVAPQVHLGALGGPAAFHEGRHGSAVLDLAPHVDGAEAHARVLEALSVPGTAALERLPYAFAAAAWDDRTRTLRLARDFVGQKPLYWSALSGGGVAFATEYKALLALPAIHAEPDLDAVQLLQCSKTTPPGRTLLRGVACAPPGAITSLGADGRPVGCEEMPALRVDVRPTSEAAAREELAQRYVEAVRPLVADQRRVGIALSGGIDSLSIAFATRHCAPAAELTGFTAGHGPDDPEIVTAARAMRHLGGRHEPVIVTAGLLHDCLPLAVWHFECPVGRSETVQMFEVGRAARAAGFDRLLSGIGSDALFAGMPKHKVLWLTQLLPPLRNDLLEFFELTQSGLAPRRPLARLMDLLYFRGAVPPVPRVAGASGWPRARPLPEPGREFLNRALVANLHESLSRSLVRVERPLQASGVDFASPFFDRNLMQYAFTLSDRLKIRRGREKYILREALGSIVPPELLHVPKGIARIRHDREFADTLQSLAERWLDTPEARRRAWFAKEEVNRIRASLRRRRYHPEAAMRLWTLVVTELWARIYLDGRGARPSPDAALREPFATGAAAGQSLQTV